MKADLVLRFGEQVILVCYDDPTAEDWEDVRLDWACGRLHCDCGRSAFLRDAGFEDIPQLACGNEIQLCTIQPHILH